MVAFDDFAVVAAAAEGAGGLFDEGEEEVDAQAHVGGEHDGDFFGGPRYGGLFGVVEARGADDPGDGGGGQRGRGGGGGGMEAEVDGDIGARGEGRGEVGGNGHAEGPAAGGGAHVLAGQRRVGAIDGGAQFEAGEGPADDEAGDRLAHAAGGAHQQDFFGGAHGYFTKPHCCRVARSFSRLAGAISHRGRR